GDKIGQMQMMLRILSGLYGVLKPLDAIRAYRLEMGTTLKLGDFENLYAFWKEKISSQLQSELQKDELVVNLASKEYFSAVDAKALSNQIISPQFKDFKNGKLKIISFFAKKARGMMARHLIDQQANTLEEILSFNKEGYAFSASETKDPMSPVFVR
ncbi:MAG: YaaA family protein, partial [Flavobacteriaceae bacterium]